LRKPAGGPETSLRHAELLGEIHVARDRFVLNAVEIAHEAAAVGLALFMMAAVAAMLFAFEKPP
jgi:hypothetical protein